MSLTTPKTDLQYAISQMTNQGKRNVFSYALRTNDVALAEYMYDEVKNIFGGLYPKRYFIILAREGNAMMMQWLADRTKWGARHWSIRDYVQIVEGAILGGNLQCIDIAMSLVRQDALLKVIEQANQLAYTMGDRSGIDIINSYLPEVYRYDDGPIVPEEDYFVNVTSAGSRHQMPALEGDLTPTPVGDYDSEEDQLSEEEDDVDDIVDEGYTEGGYGDDNEYSDNYGYSLSQYT
jgi:hypothetical protein